MSGRSTTIFFPLYALSFARVIAAYTAAPDDIPTSTPSLLPNNFPVLNASSLETVMILSYIFVSSVSGTNPAPIP